MNPATEKEHKDIIVRKYGLLPPKNWGKDCEEELFAATKYRNKLTEIHNAYIREKISIEDSASDVTELNSKIDTLVEEIAELKASKKKANSNQRRKVKTPEIDERITQIKTKLSDLQNSRSASRKESRVKNKEKLETLRSSYFAAIKAARKEAGLSWRTEELVFASFEQAVKTAGWDELRFKSFDGSGSLGCRWKTPTFKERLFSGEDSQCQITMVEDNRTGRRAGNRAVLKISIKGPRSTEDKKHRMLEFPMIYHRPLPDDYDIMFATISRKVDGHSHGERNRSEWSVVFTCRKKLETEKPKKKFGKDYDVKISWTQRKTGTLIATTFDGNTYKEIEIEPWLEDALDRVDALQSERDLALDGIVPELRKLSWSTAPPEIEAISQKVFAGPRVSSKRLAHLVKVWSRNNWEPEAFSKAFMWFEADFDMWQEQRSKRNKALRRRQHFYRNIAAELVKTARSVTIQPIDLKEAAIVKKDGENAAKLPKKVRTRRVTFAPSELILAIKNACDREGIAFERMEFFEEKLAA